jgi:hypothetical protein
MKAMGLAMMALLAMATTPAFAAKPKAEEKKSAEEISVEQQTLPRWVVILGAYKNFPEAKEDAQKFAQASKVPFTMNGMIFDKKGLRYPDNFDDPLWAGEYLARRGNAGWSGKQELEQHISVEKSEGYEGFAKGLYIVVGFIAENSKDGLAQVERFKPHAPQTYVKKTRIYMGCLH